MPARLTYIDIVKGLAVLTVFFLHFEDGVLPTDLNYFIVKSAAFFFIVGWFNALTKRDVPIGELYHKRIRSLGLPYLWFTLLIIVFDIILVVWGFKEAKFLSREMLKALTLRGVGPLWFLPALFFGQLIFFYIKDKKLGYNIAVYVAAVAYMFAYGYWSDNLRNTGEIYQIIDLPLKVIFNSFNALLVIAAGYYLCELIYPVISTYSKNKLFFVGAGIMVFSFLTTNFIDIPLGNLIFAQIFGVLGAMIMAMSLENLKAMRFLSFWGENSLIVMAIHYTILQEVAMIINEKITGSPQFTGINTIYFFIASLLLLYPITYFINKKARFLLGKK